ncbi:MAG: cell division protein FtsA [Streptococcaceae bacterium]|jgi:cell division protein FtsA|nr:cell division protein FtsA [Streptococcaceae bacterium]
MAKTGLYTGLDIGTTSVKVIVAEYIDDQMNIIGVGNAKSKGLSRGIIIDIDKTVDSIKRAIAQAEEKAGLKINNVYVGLPATSLQWERCSGMIAVSANSKEITDEDVFNVAMAAMVRSIAPERQIITLFPQEFTVDGFEGIHDPRGMIGVRLEMSGILFTGPKTIVHNVQAAVEKAGFHVDGLVISPLALAEAILVDGEKEFGTILFDLGGGQTTTAVMYDKELKFSAVDQEGGENITKDISVVLNTSYNSAEALKINYGNAYPEHASEVEAFPVDVIGKSESVKVNERYLSEIIKARLEEILLQAKEILTSLNVFDLPGGIVITGGAASIPGIIELAQDIFNVNVKLYVPNHIGLRNPVFSNVIALVEYAANLTEINYIVESTKVSERFMPVANNNNYADQPIENNLEQNVYQQNNSDDYHEEETFEKGENLVQWIKNKWSEMFD